MQSFYELCRAQSDQGPEPKEAAVVITIKAKLSIVCAAFCASCSGFRKGLDAWQGEMETAEIGLMSACLVLCMVQTWQRVQRRPE